MKTKEETISETVKNEALWKWLFAYNPYTKLWYAFKSKYCTEFFNDKEKLEKEGNLLSSKYRDLLEQEILKKEK